jgi:DNA polymerase-4
MHLHAKGWDADRAWEAEGAAGPLERIGRAMKQRIREAVDLPASVGISANKFLAKLSSDLSKPDGLKILRPQDAEGELLALPVGVIFGLGPKAQERLRRLGIRTIAELRDFGEERLVSRFGEHAREWMALARGEDRRRVHAGREQKSIGKERTFFDDIADPDELRAVLLGFTEEVARSLREERLLCRGITLKFRLGDFSTFTRSGALAEPTDETRVLWRAASALLEKWFGERRGALRLLGVSLHGLSGEKQMGLFDSGEEAPGAAPGAVPGAVPSAAPRGERQRSVDKATDAIVERFGRGAIRRGGSLRDS